jgi:hypothetical protein
MGVLRFVLYKYDTCSLRVQAKEIELQLKEEKRG